MLLNHNSELYIQPLSRFICLLFLSHTCNTISSVWLHVSFKQASLISDLKSWCLSKLQNMEVLFTGDPGRTKLRRSSSVTEGLDEAEGPELTELPAGDEGSSHCPELHSSPTLLESDRRDPSVAEGGSANHYFVVHVESSPGTFIRICHNC